MLQFFIGLDHPATAWPFLRSMISINTIRDRKAPFRINDWIMDSGGFTELSTHGRWRTSPQQYADEINRWKDNGNLVAAVTQDLMCEPFILHKTGLTIEDHQKITVARYARLLDLTNVYVMPVLQGYSPESYAAHVDQYGELFTPGQWVGVGSVCKRNGNPDQIEDILHGFGIKFHALQSPTVRQLLYSSDSMAWSFAGRKHGTEHDPRIALAYAAKIEALIVQPSFVQPQLFHWWNETEHEAR